MYDASSKPNLNEMSLNEFLEKGFHLQNMFWDVFLQIRIKAGDNTIIEFGRRFSQKHQLVMRTLQLGDFGGDAVKHRRNPPPFPYFAIYHL